MYRSFSGGGYKRNDQLNNSSIPLMWMENEAKAAGLQIKSSHVKWSEAELGEPPTDSLGLFWKVLEYLPITAWKNDYSESVPKEFRSTYSRQSRSLLDLFFSMPSQFVSLYVAHFVTSYTAVQTIFKQTQFRTPSQAASSPGVLTVVQPTHNPLISAEASIDSISPVPALSLDLKHLVLASAVASAVPIFVIAATHFMMKDLMILALVCVVIYFHQPMGHVLALFWTKSFSSLFSNVVASFGLTEDSTLCAAICTVISA